MKRGVNPARLEAKRQAEQAAEDERRIKVASDRLTEAQQVVDAYRLQLQLRRERGRPSGDAWHQLAAAEAHEARAWAIYDDVKRSVAAA